MAFNFQPVQPAAQQQQFEFQQQTNPQCVICAQECCEVVVPGDGSRPYFIHCKIKQGSPDFPARASRTMTVCPNPACENCLIKLPTVAGKNPGSLRWFCKDCSLQGAFLGMCDKDPFYKEPNRKNPTADAGMQETLREISMSLNNIMNGINQIGSGLQALHDFLHKNMQ